LGELVAGGVAQQAGLRRGDQILKIQGRTVQDAQHLRALIRQSVQDEVSAPGPQVWEVSRRGQFGVLLIEVQPRRVALEGQVIGRVDAMIGDTPAKVWVQQGFVDGWVKGSQRTWELSWLTLRTLGKMLIGEASVRHLSGPLTMAEYAGKSAQLGLAAFLNYLALVSISLGVLNLLPIPVLDGGHLMYYLWEGLTRRRPSLAWTGWLQRLGTAFVLLLMLIALRNDLLRWLEGG
jgi:regulator of sigma E protease